MKQISIKLRDTSKVINGYFIDSNKIAVVFFLYYIINYYVI